MQEQAKWPEVQQWLSDPEFNSQDYKTKQRILENYFDQELADQEFYILDYEEQQKIKDNFTRAHIGEDPAPAPAQAIAPPEDPELTAGRLGHQIVARFGKGIEHMVRGEEVIHGKRPRIPEGQYPTRETEFDEGNFLKGLLNRPELRKELAKDEFYQKRQKAIEELKPGYEYFPEPLPGSSGIVEEGIAGMAEFGPGMIAQAVNPVVGAATIFETIVGSKHEEYTAQGIDNERATKLAILTAAIQTPIEFAGNLLQFRFLTNMAKKFGSGAAGKIATFVTEFLKMGATEGTEEFLQTPPEEIINIVAANPDLTGWEVVKEGIRQSPDILARSAYGFGAGAIGGMALGGVSGMVMAPAQMAIYKSEKQKQIDDARAAEKRGEVDVLDPGPKELLKKVQKEEIPEVVAEPALEGGMRVAPTRAAAPSAIPEYMMEGYRDAERIRPDEGRVLPPEAITVEEPEPAGAIVEPSPEEAAEPREDEGREDLEREEPTEPGDEEEALEKPVLGSAAKAPKKGISGGQRFANRAVAQRFINQHDFHPTKEPAIVYTRDIVPSGDVTEGYGVRLFEKGEATEWQTFDVEVGDTKVGPMWETDIKIKAPENRQTLHKNRNLVIDVSGMRPIKGTQDAEISLRDSDKKIEIRTVVPQDEAKAVLHNLEMSATNLNVEGFEDYFEPEPPKAVIAKTLDQAAPGHKFEYLDPKYTYEDGKIVGREGYQFQATKRGSPIYHQKLTVADLKPETIKKAVDEAIGPAEPEVKEDRWIEGHLQTPDRFDRWWTHLIRARDAAGKVGITNKDVDWNSLESIVAMVDAYDQGEIKEPAAAEPEIVDKYERQIEDLKHKARMASQDPWREQAEAEADRRGIKGRFLSFAHGSRAEPQWSRDIFEKVYQEELAKRQPQIDKLQRKIDRIKARAEKPSERSLESYQAEIDKLYPDEGFNVDLVGAEGEMVPPGELLITGKKEGTDLYKQTFAVKADDIKAGVEKKRTGFLDEKARALAKRPTGVMYKEKVEVEETGEIVEGEREASEALKEVQSDLEGYRKLLDCIQS